MKVSYKNSRDEKFYCDEDALISRHNVIMSRKICQRMSELAAADNALQLPKSARFHEHKGKRKGLFSIDLIHPFRLIVCPTCLYNNWSEITSVEIDEIFNPHK